METPKLQEPKLASHDRKPAGVQDGLAGDEEHLVWDTSGPEAHQQAGRQEGFCLKTVQDAQIVLFHVRVGVCTSMWV